MDIARGQAARISQGNSSSEVAFGDPAIVVRDFLEAGATWIHIVDLDKAFGAGDNQELIRDTISSFPQINFQISGGICDEDSFGLAISSGARRINISSLAYKNFDWLSSVFADTTSEICFALDVKDGRVQPRVSKEDLGDLNELLKFLSSTKCKHVSVTDVEKDGMLNGPNIELLEKVSTALGFPVISSGGIATLEDLERLLESESCSGAILGKALYEKRFSLAQAIALVA